LVSQRDVVLIRVEFTDGSGTKQRPVVVISNDSHNKMSPDFIAVAVTTNIKHFGYTVEINSKRMEAGIIEPGIIKIDTIGSFHQARIIKTIGRVKPEVLDEIKKGLSQIFS
jgi:mRNA-degrading endonuclease toxin of MazEF toxin-antitoxin module